jgi:hypothetical protein
MTSSLAPNDAYPNLKILTSTLLIAYPGLTHEMLDYEIQGAFVKSSQNAALQKQPLPEAINPQI